MIGVFKQKNPRNAFLLFVYALVLKFTIFLHPVIPEFDKEDNYFYRLILNTLTAVFGHQAVFFFHNHFSVDIFPGHPIQQDLQLSQIVAQAKFSSWHGLHSGNFSISGLESFFRTSAGQFYYDMGMA